MIPIGNIKRPNIGIARIKNQEDRVGDGWSGEVIMAITISLTGETVP
jgi:hypothetical protein